MVIQRIQTLYLLISTICMAMLSALVPIASTSAGGTTIVSTAVNVPQLFIINALAALLSLIAIFLFKKLPSQIRVTRICVVISIMGMLLQAYIGYLYWGEHNTEVNVVVPVVLYIIAIVADFLAIKGMVHDQKLLNYDRLR